SAALSAALTMLGITKAARMPRMITTIRISTSVNALRMNVSFLFAGLAIPARFVRLVGPVGRPAKKAADPRQGIGRSEVRRQDTGSVEPLAIDLVEASRVHLLVAGDAVIPDPA